MNKFVKFGTFFKIDLKKCLKIKKKLFNKSSVVNQLIS